MFFFRRTVRRPVAAKGQQHSEADSARRRYRRNRQLERVRVRPRRPEGRRLSVVGLVVIGRVDLARAGTLRFPRG